MDHRIDSTVFNNCSSLDEEQKKNLRGRMKKLQSSFTSLCKFHDNHHPPKREGMEHVTRHTQAPPGNIMPYIPSKTFKKSPCVHNWNTFVKTIGMVNTHDDNVPAKADNTKRLDAFLSLDENTPPQVNSANLPYIHSDAWWKAASLPKKDDTWREILHGLPEQNGKWEATLRVHNNKASAAAGTSSKARNMPLSAVPFVQSLSKS